MVKEERKEGGGATEDFESAVCDANFVRLQWVLLAFIAGNGLMAFLGHEIGVLGRILPRTGQLADFLVSPIFLGGLWLMRARPVAEQRAFVWAAVGVQAFASAWYFYVALPVFGPTAVFALTVIAMGVFVLVPPRVFAALILPATIFHIGLAAFSSASLAVKILVVMHGIVAAAIALLAQKFLFAAKRSEFLRDAALFREVESLRQSSRRLESHCRDMQENTALAAHDLKGPLQSLVAALRLASQRKEWRKEPYSSFLREAIGTCVGLADLGGRILNDYQNQNRRSEPGRRVVDILPILREAAASLKGKAEERGVAMKFLLPDSAALARVDPATLRGAVENLLDNAIAYSPSSSTVEVRLDRVGGSWRIGIQDSGPGIPAGERESLFQRFFQASNRPADAPPSNGLGLSIARQRIESLHGTLTLESSTKDGALFVISLPVSEAGVWESQER